MARWNFPGNQDGQVKGVADAGIENFNGTELSSLARENCQNSLDAALNDSNPDVLVEFERYFVPKKQIPGIMEYRNILKKCKAFWDRSKSEKAKLFLKDAIKEAEKENTFFIQIRMVSVPVIILHSPGFPGKPVRMLLNQRAVLITPWVITSRNTRIPRLCAFCTRRLKSSSVPRVGSILSGRMQAYSDQIL